LFCINKAFDQFLFPLSISLGTVQHTKDPNLWKKEGQFVIASIILERKITACRKSIRGYSRILVLLNGWLKLYIGAKDGNY